MIPSIGQYVKILFKNGFSESGFVYEWGKHIVLEASDGSSVTVIKNIDDIFLYKILINKKDEKPVSDVYIEPVQPKQYRRDPVDRGLHLLELHKLRAEEERNRAREKLTTFSPISGTVHDDRTILLGNKPILFNTTKKD